MFTQHEGEIRENEEGSLYGIFDGESMVEKSGKKHRVPENYASKSHLIEGDGLRMMFTDDGIRFKQVSKVPRVGRRGTVKMDDLSPSGFSVLDKTSGKYYYVIRSTATYFNFEHDMEVYMIVPKNDPDARYCSIETTL